MKPFDLKAALAGAPVVTREGFEVTQLTRFDVTGDNRRCVMGVCENRVLSFFEDGLASQIYGPNGNDLFMKSTLCTLAVQVHYDPKSKASYIVRPDCPQPPFPPYVLKQTVVFEWEE